MLLKYLCLIMLLIKETQPKNLNYQVRNYLSSCSGTGEEQKVIMNLSFEKGLGAYLAKFCRYDTKTSSSELTYGNKFF